MPPTTGGRTSGSSTNERSRRRPRSRLRASTSAIGTPNATQRTVLATAVRRLSSNAARDDSDVSSEPKCDQGTLISIASNGSRTNSPPTTAGTKSQPGTALPALCCTAGAGGVGGLGSTEAGITEDLPPLRARDEVGEAAGEFRVLAAGQYADGICVHGFRRLGEVDR